jgi:fibronectin-binding autotransporter adhesin
MNIADSLLTLADNVTAASAMLNLTGTAKAVLTNNASAGNATVNVSKDSTWRWKKCQRGQCHRE